MFDMFHALVPTDRNIQLAFFGGILAFVGCFVQDGKLIREHGFMQGLQGLESKKSIGV